MHLCPMQLTEQFAKEIELDKMRTELASNMSLASSGHVCYYERCAILSTIGLSLFWVGISFILICLSFPSNFLSSRGWVFRQKRWRSSRSWRMRCRL